MDAAELTTVPEMLGQLLEKHSPVARFTKCLKVAARCGSSACLGKLTSKGGKHPLRMQTLREKHDFRCMTICILLFVVINSNKPCQSESGFGVVAKVPFSYTSEKLKA